MTMRTQEESGENSFSVHREPVCVGRTSVFNRIYGLLSGYETNAVVLYGPDKIGKTTILKALVENLPERGKYHPLYFNIKDKRILSPKVEGIGPDESLLDDSFLENLNRSFIDRLSNPLPPGAVLVLLFDDFHLLADRYGKSAFSQIEKLMSYDPDRLQFVFSTDRRLDDVTDALLKDIEKCHVTFLSQEETGQLVASADKNKAISWNGDTLRQIWELTGGHPYFIHQLCDVLFKYASRYSERITVSSDIIESSIPETLSHANSLMQAIWDKLPEAVRGRVPILADRATGPEGAPVENEMENTLELLEKGDVIERTGDRFYFTVELMRRWFSGQESQKPRRKKKDSATGKKSPVRFAIFLLLFTVFLIGSTIFVYERYYRKYFNDENTLPDATAPSTQWTVETLSNSGRKIHDYRLPMDGKSQVLSVAFSRDGKYLAAALDNCDILVWNLSEPNKSPADIKGHGDSVMTIAFGQGTKDELYLASGSMDGTVRLWNINKDLSKSYEHESFMFHKGGDDKGRGVMSVALSSDGKYLASGSSDNTVAVWEIDQDVIPRVLKDHEDCVHTVAFKPGSNIIVSSGGSGIIRRWNFENQEESIPFGEGHKESVTNIVFNRRGTKLASASYDEKETILVWDFFGTAGRKDKKPIPIKAAYGITFNADGNLLVAGLSNSTILVWDLVNEKDLRTLTGHTGKVRSVAFNPKGDLLASGSEDGTVRLWSIKDDNRFGQFIKE